ncbi:MAG: PD40 domain-containing protein [Acidobacteria bacterium]|nr:PD40 domain-containing protein [Acidobacteriota bacterium]MBI3422844.1 PD40 domain-containing protein [Acidobacteriota bacterium]
MTQQTKHFYEFSHFRVDPQERSLFRKGKLVALTPKVFDTLLALVEHRAMVVSRNELLKEVWPDTFVEEGNLTQNISMLRKLLGEHPDEPQFIETVPRRGYRFVADVTEVAGEKFELQSHRAADSTQPHALPVYPEVEPPALTRKSRLGWAALLALGIAGIAFAAYQWMTPKPTAHRPLAVNRLTYTGKVAHVAISPDGKYVAQAVAEGGNQSLWLRQTAAPSEIEIVPPAEAAYLSLTFSADGNFLYFVRGHQDVSGEGSFSERGTLFKMPVLGKNEKKLLDNVDGHLSLSPDGAWLAFVRQTPKQGKSALMLAKTDGSEEKELALRKFPDNFLPGGPAWSPDGKVIACSTNNFSAETPYRGIVGIRVADGVETPIGSKHWYGATRRLAWLADGSGLLVLGSEYSRGLNQIWRLSYSANEAQKAAQKITNDLNDYTDLSMTADAQTMAVVSANRGVNLWVAPANEATRAKAITSGSGREDGVRGLAWTPDGRIVYRSMSGEAPQIWIMNADGMGAKQLSTDSAEHFDPTVSPDGKVLVWSSSAAGRRNLWQMNLDGSNPRKVTNGNNEWHPEFSPDGQWLIFTTMVYSLAKVPVNSGPIVRLTNGLSWRSAISPDGQWIAYNRLDEANGYWQIGVIPFESSAEQEPSPKIFNAPSASVFRALRWTVDGKEIAYPVTVGNVSNLWSQPLAGGPPRQLTNFNDQLIFDFAWSRDGRQLALSRGIVNRDVVIISNFR